MNELDAAEIAEEVQSMLSYNLGVVDAVETLSRLREISVAEARDFVIANPEYGRQYKESQAAYSKIFNMIKNNAN